MLFVKTKVKKSKIHGKGLFADQDIKKGQIIWRYNSKLDKKIPMKKLFGLSEYEQNFIKFHSYLNDRNEFVLCGDVAKYINHSDEPNTKDVRTF